MISTRLFQLLRLSRQLSFQVGLMAALALLAVLVAPAADPLIPGPWKDRFGQDAVLPVLNVLASSMLAVTTFSLGVMVQASQSASSLATPRAYRILMQDRTTHSVLATFVGSFLFSLAAIAMFRAHYYDAAASVVVFMLTILVIAAIIAAILRWIGHLSRLGSMDHVLNLIEDAALPPLQAMMARPALGAHVARGEDTCGSGAYAVAAPRSGYIQLIDMPQLQGCMEEGDGHLWILRATGDYVVEGDCLARSSASEEVRAALAAGFTIGKSRTLEQDARYGIMILAETAARALSPGVNDPGTAIDVVHRLTALLAGCGAPTEDSVEGASESRVACDRITAPAIQAEDLIEDGFDLLIRDSAGRVEVTGIILHALDRLRRCEWPELARAARARMDYALDLAEAYDPHPDDIARLSAIVTR